MRLVLFVALLLSSALALSSDRPRVSVCVDDWPPHIVNNADRSIDSSPLLLATKAILEEGGYEIEVIWAPWKRCLENVRLGVWETSIGWTVTAERARVFYYSETLMNSYHRFFSLKEVEFDWQDWKDLKGMRIGTTLGYNYGEPFTEYQQKGILITEDASTDESNLKKLLKGHIDLFVINQSAAWSTAKQFLTEEELQRLSLHPKPVSTDRTAHAIFAANPKGHQLKTNFDNAIKRLKEKGAFTPLFDYLNHSYLGP